MRNRGQSGGGAHTYGHIAAKAAAQRCVAPHHVRLRAGAAPTTPLQRCHTPKHAHVRKTFGLPPQTDLRMRMFFRDDVEARPVDDKEFEELDAIDELVRRQAHTHSTPLAAVLADWCCHPQAMLAVMVLERWRSWGWVLAFASESPTVMQALCRDIESGRAAALHAALAASLPAAAMPRRAAGRAGKRPRSASANGGETAEAARVRARVTSAMRVDGTAGATSSHAAGQADSGAALAESAEASSGSECAHSVLVIGADGAQRTRLPSDAGEDVRAVTGALCCAFAACPASEAQCLRTTNVAQSQHPSARCCSASLSRSMYRSSFDPTCSSADQVPVARLVAMQRQCERKRRCRASERRSARHCLRLLRAVRHRLLPAPFPHAAGRRRCHAAAGHDTVVRAIGRAAAAARRRPRPGGATAAGAAAGGAVWGRVRAAARCARVRGRRCALEPYARVWLHTVGWCGRLGTQRRRTCCGDCGVW